MERQRPRMLLLSMYSLGEARSGPTVRIGHMRSALDRLVDLDVVAGARGRRATALARYAASGRQDGLAGIYVESSTALPGPADIAFLARARRRGIPVLTYIRDAYQLFPEYWASTSPKARAGRRLFLPALRRLAAASSVVAFPSQGLADALSLPQPVILLPPGAPAGVEVERRPDANRLLVVGALRQPTLGADLLLSAVAEARHRGSRVELTCVSRPGEEPPGILPSWVHVERATGTGIHALLPLVFATVIPRRRSAYNDLSIPIKLMDYLSYGRPLLVTDCTETAHVVQSAGAGLVVADHPHALADGIVALFTADIATMDRYAAAGLAAAASNAWRFRAEQVVATLLRAKV